MFIESIIKDYQYKNTHIDGLWYQLQTEALERVKRLNAILGKRRGQIELPQFDSVR